MAAALGFVRPTFVAVLAYAAIFLAAVDCQPIYLGPPGNPFLSFLVPVEHPTKDTHYFVTCENRSPKCTVASRLCPPGCPDLCYVHCPSCKLVCHCDRPGSGCYDPRFVGGDGNTFLFHGRKDADFCLLSDGNLHINARFIGKRNAKAARDFTWVQALGVRFGDHRLYLGVKKTATWDNSVDRLMIAFNGEPVYLEGEPNAKWRSPAVTALSVTRTGAANGVVVQLDGRFRVVANAVPVTEKDSEIHNYGVTPDDSLAHLNVAFKFNSLSANVHGVLGQTYRPDYISPGIDRGAKVPVMRGADKYASSGIFATDCAVARFIGEDGGSGSVDMISEPTDALCASGKGGVGLICKK